MYRHASDAIVWVCVALAMETANVSPKRAPRLSSKGSLKPPVLRRGNLGPAKIATARKYDVLEPAQRAVNARGGRCDVPTQEKTSQQARTSLRIRLPLEG